MVLIMTETDRELLLLAEKQLNLAAGYINDWGSHTPPEKSRRPCLADDIQECRTLAQRIARHIKSPPDC